jgi:type I restriction enzyme S subunit
MSEFPTQRLDEFIADGSVLLGRGDVISKDDIDAHPGPYPIYSSSAHNNGKFGEYGKFMFDEELITWSVDGGGYFFYRPKHKYSVTNVCGYMRLRGEKLHPKFVYYSLANQHRYLTFDYTSKAHPSVIKKQYWLPTISREQQQKIASILTCIDTAIEKTEALIAKYQQIKAGLMHDLFTRGVTADGKLRPPREQAPELYQETPIGWIPKEWDVKSLNYALESVVDGPFGSNLKTEHYVVDPGVRVVRLQNVVESDYNDNDRAYISERHASYLLRNKVVGGDVLIAGLGEERYPVGRACCYPDDIASAINKADCFRARCNPEVMKNRFFMLFLNSGMARRQVRRYEQGVTRPRINTSNLKRISISVPSLDEQSQIVAKFDAVQSVIQVEQDNVAKLRDQKLGLMSDLLTGNVRVNKEEATYG